jgi:dTDP-4-dehydrorhamnose 3,5-epimerase
VKIPPGIWNGFKGTGTIPAIVANCATEPHDAAEITRKDPVPPAFGYDWAIRFR